MLREALAYLTTPCDPHLRTLGYLRELIATEARFRRCHAAWRPHTENTRSVIRDAVARTERRGRAVVLGAGILCDIPLDTLAEAFDQVCLIDVCFLRATRRQVRAYPNVTLHTQDITGVAAPLARGEIPVPPFPEGLSLADADLIVSANVLAQLPLIPVEHLRKIRPASDDETLLGFGRAIVDGHLSLLESCPGTICLISETERFVSSERGEPYVEDPLWGVEIPFDGPTWDWRLAPPGEIAGGVTVVDRVRASIRADASRSTP